MKKSFFFLFFYGLENNKHNEKLRNAIGKPIFFLTFFSTILLNEIRA